MKSIVQIYFDESNAADTSLDMKNNINSNLSKLCSKFCSAFTPFQLH